MKRFTTILVLPLSLGLLLLGRPAQCADDPCQDPSYLTLKNKDVNTLTQREYEIFKEKDRQCSQYQLSMKNNQETRKTISEATNYTWIYVVGAIVILATLIPYALR